jgi:transposase
MMPACSQARMAWQHAGLRSSAPDFGRQPDLLITIPGIGPRVALVIISESGPETAEYFLTEAHRASWAGLCPVTTNRPAKREHGRSAWQTAWSRSVD